MIKINDKQLCIWSLAVIGTPHCVTPNTQELTLPLRVQMTEKGHE
jgi:hypothetical protein